MFEKTQVPILGIIENMSYFLAPDTGKEYKLYGESTTKDVSEKLNINEAFNIVINNGEQAGQTVFHLHIHLLAGRNFSDLFPG